MGLEWIGGLDLAHGCLCILCIYSINQGQTPSQGQKDGAYQTHPTAVNDAYTYCSVHVYACLHGHSVMETFNQVGGVV